MTTTPSRSSAAPVLRLSLIYGAALFAAMAIVGSIVGALVSELPGLLSALIGAGMGFVFLAVTAVSILLADGLTKGDLLSPVFFAVVLGAWLLKFVVFLVLVFTLREAPFVDTTVLFATLVLAVLGGLVTDLVAVSRGRVPHVSDIALPGDSER